MHGHRGQCINSLNKIAKFNGVAERIPSDADFVEDPNSHEHAITSNNETRLNPLDNDNDYHDGSEILDEDVPPSIHLIFIELTTILIGQQFTYSLS